VRRVVGVNAWADEADDPDEPRYVLADPAVTGSASSSWPDGLGAAPSDAGAYARGVSRPGRPVRIAVLDDYEIVVAGVAAVLEPYAERVEVVEIDSVAPTLSEVDIVLHDAFGRPPGAGVDLESLEATDSPKVVVFSWNLQPDLVAHAIDHGAAGYLAKSLTAEEIVTALERVHAGECVRALGAQAETPAGTATSPGLEHGLTHRELEILTLITDGLTNQEIAERCYLSVNSVKTYIRNAYRKIGVARRAQAVAWGIDNGLAAHHALVAGSRTALARAGE
jgi:NarL family two-component system response regulator LiaR